MITLWKITNIQDIDVKYAAYGQETKYNVIDDVPDTSKSSSKIDINVRIKKQWEKRERKKRNIGITKNKKFWQHLYWCRRK